MNCPSSLDRVGEAALAARVSHLVDAVAGEQSFQAPAGARLLAHRSETLGVGDRALLARLRGADINVVSDHHGVLLDAEASTRPVDAAHPQARRHASSQAGVHQRQDHGRVRGARRQRLDLVMKEADTTLARTIPGGGGMARRIVRKATIIDRDTEDAGEDTERAQNDGA